MNTPSPQMAELLAQLRDIQPPPEPAGPWWPLILISLCLLLVAAAAVAYWLHWRKQPHWYRQARTSLEQALKTLQQQPTPAQLLQLNHVLKRIALSVEQRDQVASLQGRAWCAWLDKKGHCNHFTQGVGQCLGDPYNPALNLNQGQVNLLQQALKDWLKQQKPQALPPATFFKLDVLQKKLQGLAMRKKVKSSQKTAPKSPEIQTKETH